MGAPVPIGNNEALIVLSRAMCEGALGKHWRRFILTKELMHVFDEENEKTDTPEKLDHQINQFGDPTAAVTPQYNAELKALWRALGVLCTVEKRAAYKSQLIEQTISFEVVAAALRLPVLAVRLLMRDDFETLLHNSM